MKSQNDGVESVYRGGKRNRQVRALERLKAQLKRGMRPPKKHEQTVSDVPLSDSDVKRIEKEINILNQKTGGQRVTN